MTIHLTRFVRVNMTPNFELWLETEEYKTDLFTAHPCENFCNISVQLDDGRCYVLSPHPEF
jgi:hypothetical protein